MLGRQPAQLLEVRAVEIHRQKFYDLAFALESSPQQARVSRLGQESVYPDPQPGDAVTIHLIMGQATHVEKRS